MERFLHLWRGVDKLSFSFAEEPNGLVCRLAAVNDRIFLLTTSNHLYHGEVILSEKASLELLLKKAPFAAFDIASNSKDLLVVDENGHVLKIHPENLEVLDTIILKEDIRSCCHGYKEGNETVKVRSVAASDQAALFVTESGQLWASGEQPEIDIKTKEPKKVTFFEDRRVARVACGNNFNAIIARKAGKALKDDTDSENDLEEEVFVESCPHCLSNASNPANSTADASSSQAHQLGSRAHSITSISTLPIGTRESDTASTDTSKRDTASDVVDSEDNCLRNQSVEPSDKEEKKNVIFINTEAARQFLTRQLSWVSSYGSTAEDAPPAETAEKPTRLIKQNVSNMANLVYEGVKNVGGKVVTLSRHMSGSSDINEYKDESGENVAEVGEDTLKAAAANTSLTLSLRCEEFPWSSSTGSSEHELSQQGFNEKIELVTRAGSNILSNELWVWGDKEHGQLGTGDTIRRQRPVLVAKFNNTGIKKIACGSFHILALTPDGRVFAWGRNNHKQVSLDSVALHSAPQLFTTQLSLSERAKDIAAGDFHSLVMMHHGLYFIGKSSKPGEMFHLDVETEKEYSPREIFSSGQYSCCSVINKPAINISEELAVDQIHLEEMLVIYQNLIKPFQKKGGATQETNVYETLCKCYMDLLSVTVSNVISLLDYSNHAREAYEVTAGACIEEYITVHKYYLNAVCDVISLGGFAYIAKLIEVPHAISNLFLDKLRPNEGKKLMNELVIAMALQHPLNKLSRFKGLIASLLKCNGTRMGSERLQEALAKWEQLCDEQEKRQKEAETTKHFWENSGKIGEYLRSPDRRLIRESRTNPISILNSGRFTSHWFILLTDIFIHVTGASHTVHSLTTLWVEPLSDSDALQNAISVIAPEESFVLYTPTPHERNEWLHALQNSIKNSLQRVLGASPPVVRSSSFYFTKHSVYKESKYTGRWLNGKPHGSGRIEWADGRVYVGQFHKGVIHGNGKMETPSQGVYEGQWKDGQQNGYGTMKYSNGDLYEGYFKDGLPHGHGVKKEGHFMATLASVYIGEWAAGVKQGYGIMDDIMTGEKYLGSWSNGMKHGCGLIVTLDGIYYEGVFTQDVLTGHGVMVFEDGTHYEGEFKSAGIFYGKGTLTFRSGERLEGNMNGAWNEGVKVMATLHMNKSGGNVQINSKPTSFGKLCVSPDQKWKAIFRQCYLQLGVPEPGSKASANDKSAETQRIWQNVASIITKSHQKTLQRRKTLTSASVNRDKESENIDHLDKIPCFGRDNLTTETYNEIHKYLIKAFESPHHPLGALLSEVATVYTATYGGVRVHPLLLSHAVLELHSITSRIYEMVILLFPALPRGGKEYVLETDLNDEGQVISAAAILHPILLPRVHSALFVLYALHNKKEDDAYWERLIKWNKQPDITLMAFLDIDQKFWKNANIINVGENAMPYQSEPFFSDAIETLQQLKTTFSPLEKLLVVRNTFEQMTQAVQKQLGSSYLWTMDELFPVFCFVVVRASVLQLGSEIHFIEDFMEPYLQNGELGIMFTTLKACYYQILQEKMNVGD